MTNDRIKNAPVRRKSAPKPDDPAQSKRFIDAAREAQADETDEGANQAFKKVARPPRKKGA
jgi:hypothetical protein